MIKGDPANVLDYGAVGDGVTDDTAAFAAALAANPLVYVPCGTYIVENLSIPSNKTLFGGGKETILKLPAASIFRVIVTSGSSDATVRDLTLDARGTGTSIALFTTCIRINLLNIWATGSASHGIEFDNCGGCVLDGAEVYSTGGASSSAAVYLKNPTGNGSYNTVSNVYFRNINGRGIHNLENNFTQISNIRADMTNGESILVQDSTAVIMQSITHTGAEPAAAALSDGIAIEGNCLYCVLDGFLVANSAGHAVSIGTRAGANGAAYCTVSNGIVVNADECGVSITDQGEANAPTANVVSNVVVQNAGKQIPNASFNVSGGSNNQFVNCTALDNQGTSTTTYGFQENNTGANTATSNSFSGRLIGTFTVEDYDLSSTLSCVRESTKTITPTWCTFNGNGGATIIGSSNVASVVRNSAGNYTITFNNPMPAGYPISAIARSFTGNNCVQIDTAPTSTSVTVQVFTDAGLSNDSDYISVRVG